MKIIRTPNKVAGGITDAEKIALDAHAQKWIENALRTDPVDPDRLIPAIKALYAAADLQEPRIIIVPSPLVMAFAGGFSAAILAGHSTNATRNAYAATTYATRDAIYDATTDATRAATTGATRDAIYDATTDAAIYDATYDATTRATTDATHAATYAATTRATDAATHAATYAATTRATTDATEATRDAIYDATTRAADDRSKCYDGFITLARVIGDEFGVDPKHLLSVARRWEFAYQGGNMWSSWVCYLTAFRDVLGLRLPEYDKFRAWEDCAIEGGFRFMHAEFCIVSDRPECIRMDAENRPHCEDGPSHRWRDGWSLYYWHGVSIPGEWVTGNPPSAKDAIIWPNIEQRRAACEIVGWARILRELDARVIDEDGDPEIGTLLEADIPDSGPERFLRVKCGTGREFVLPVPRDMHTAIAANAWTYGLNQKDFTPEVRT